MSDYSLQYDDDTPHYLCRQDGVEYCYFVATRERIALQEIWRADRILGNCIDIINGIVNFRWLYAAIEEMEEYLSHLLYANDYAREYEEAQDDMDKDLCWFREKLKTLENLPHDFPDGVRDNIRALADIFAEPCKSRTPALL